MFDKDQCWWIERNKSNEKVLYYFEIFIIIIEILFKKKLTNYRAFRTSTVNCKIYSLDVNGECHITTT